MADTEHYDVLDSSVRSAQPRPTLVVVTPARNEAPNISELVRSVRQQTRLPDRWVIVDDTSTDCTADRAAELCADLPFVSIVQLHADSKRSFAAKVGAVHAGVDAGATSETEILINLDADAVLPPDYFASVLSAFEQDPKLGVFGGAVGWSANGERLRPVHGPTYHVPGPGQAIRMKAWNDVGGYWPLLFGGEDVAIYVAASMFGWTSRNDENLLIELRRPTGAGANQSATRSMYERGMQDYDLGRSFWFESLKLTRWLFEPPVFCGAAARASGFVIAAVHQRRTVSPDFVRHLRRREREQLRAAVFSLRDRRRR